MRRARELISPDHAVHLRGHHVQVVPRDGVDAGGALQRQRLQPENLLLLLKGALLLQGGGNPVPRSDALARQPDVEQAGDEEDKEQGDESAPPGNRGNRRRLLPDLRNHAHTVSNNYPSHVSLLHRFGAPRGASRCALSGFPALPVPTGRPACGSTVQASALLLPGREWAAGTPFSPCDLSLIHISEP